MLVTSLSVRSSNWRIRNSRYIDRNSDSVQIHCTRQWLYTVFFCRIELPVQDAYLVKRGYFSRWLKMRVSENADVAPGRRGKHWNRGKRNSFVASRGLEYSLPSRSGKTSCRSGVREAYILDRRREAGENDEKGEYETKGHKKTCSSRSWDEQAHFM